METESEPYVRLASLRQLHHVVAQLNTARSLADTLQTVADGVVEGLGFEIAAVHLVRAEGELVVAAVAGSAAAEAMMAGRSGSRTAWERRLSMGQQWGVLHFVPYTEGWVLDDDEVPEWHAPSPVRDTPDAWHPMDRLFAPLYASDGELLGVLSVDRPRNGRRPGAWGCEALQMYASQAAIAISNARLRSNMQRALVRLEREQQALRASEESFRQAFEYAPSGMAVAEMGGDQHGRLLRINDALCRLLGRPAAAMRRYSFSDLVHPEDIRTLLRTSAEGGRAELRLARRDGSYVWVSLRNSVVADTADGPRYLLTHVEDIEERKRHELQLAHRASHDQLTGLPNSAELRARLGSRLCARPDRPAVQSSVLPGAGPSGYVEGGPGQPYGQGGGFWDLDGLGAIPGAGTEPGTGRPAAGTRQAPAPYATAVAPGGPPGSPGAGGFGGFGGSGADGGADPYHVHAVPPKGDGPGEKGLAVLFCDLDGFKSINDRYGHHCGDGVLIAVARRLEAGVRDEDTVARLGGDEFVVLADGLGPAEAQDLAVRLRNAIIPPIQIDGRTVRVGASFGIGWAGCGMTAEEVLQSADQRMYVEKRSRSKGQRRAG
ncbi:diguanylate cyclase CdgB [Streptomyces qinglanensis]|uniref:PAS domain S-box-containing protein/diguanylate cyclase (GGDEF) domain-containing protein n=1 Tax=Streptomyces qinglanensis TaxID=943816 RepID=A0A1H9WL72_9ACTN|nr:diguanylate cyclase CdgB [Streptomyces qinglanensis]SES34584.1 PAS domain S-box-containing protein/diguanylate cyclase (GGDEF) domain-containing protein [Streptomyces qinglanensis]